jgi:multiple sugar transport system permease protein
MSFKVVGAYPAEVAVLKQLGLYDQIYGAWIQKIVFIGIYYFIYQAAFYNIPNDYLDSARIDGASEYMVMFRVMIPLVKNVFFTIVLLNFIGYWNDYQAPNLYIPSWPILTFGLHWLEQNLAQEMSNEPARIAGCIIVAIPILIIFLAFKSRIMGSITFGGIKE